MEIILYYLKYTMRSDVTRCHEGNFLSQIEEGHSDTFSEDLLIHRLIFENGEKLLNKLNFNRSLIQNYFIIINLTKFQIYEIFL